MTGAPKSIQKRYLKALCIQYDNQKIERGAITADADTGSDLLAYLSSQT